MSKKTCGFCIHGAWEEDLSVGIFGHYECDNPEMPEDYVWSEGQEKGCEFFGPIMIDHCGNCHKTMNTPLYQCETIFHGMFGDIPCCSNDCRDELNSKERKEMMHMG